MSEKDQLLQEVTNNMAAIRRLMISCMQRFDHKTTASQTEALMVVENEGPITQKKLAERMQLTPGSITQLVEQLERMQFVARTTSDSDRRVVHVSITQKGSDELSTLKSQKEELFKNVYKELSLEEIRTMDKVHKKMIAYLKAKVDENESAKE